MEDSSLDEAAREQTKGELAGSARDRPSTLFLALGVGFAVLFLAWTILRTYREAFPS
jgi:hypothetical protein